MQSQRKQSKPAPAMPEDLSPIPLRERIESRENGGDRSALAEPASTSRTPGAASRPRREASADWSLLMAQAQEGDGAAYAHLLKDITPYLRNLAAARLQTAVDIEDAVQDVLLTVHRLRHTYDPDRPFGPWLATIARRRVIDRHRKLARGRRC